MIEVLLDALKDSSIVLAVVFISYILISFIEDKISKALQKHRKAAPFFGALFGLIPQCGVSVVASDLYIKRHLTMGTIVAVFFACSDEALPIIFSNPNKIIMLIPLLLIKLILGLLIGFIVDLIFTSNKKEVEEHNHHCIGEEIEVHTGCCNHAIDDQEESKWHKHLVHPLLHSLKIFAYVLCCNIIFSLLVYYIGEDNISQFLNTNKHLTPLVSTLVGLIPNCASSVIITNLYTNSYLPFGAALSGLCVNAGLGFVILFKEKSLLKETFTILGILFIISLIVGYTCLFIF